MVDHRVLSSLIVVALLWPASSFADVPGLPPAVPPECPPGTTLEGPYRHWRCVPAPPPVPDDPLSDLVDEPPRVVPVTPELETVSPEGVSPEPVSPEPVDPEPVSPEPERVPATDPVPADPPAPDEPGPPASSSGCGCRSSDQGDSGFAWLAGLALFWRGRRRP